MSSIFDFFHSIDLLFFRYLNSEFAHDFFDIFFPVITDLHKTSLFRAIFLPFVLLLFIYFKKVQGLVIYIGLFLSIAISDGIGGTIKRTVMRARPFDAAIDAVQRSAAGGYSFPSNHALNIFCAAVFLSYFFPRYRAPFLIFAALIGLSRIYNGVHYPSDVLVGTLIGSISGYLGARATAWFLAQLDQRKKESHV